MTYPVATALENDLKGFDNPVAKIVVELVRVYEHGGAASPEEAFDINLVESLKQVFSSGELSDFCLRIYAAVARDIAVYAQGADKSSLDQRVQARKIGAQISAVKELLDVLDSRLLNLDEEGEPADEELAVTEVLENLHAAGWDPDSRDVLGRTLLHKLTGDETLYHSSVADAVSFLLHQGANVNAQDNYGLTPLHLAAVTGCGMIETLLANGADKTLRTTKSASISLYAAWRQYTIPAGYTAYDLAVKSKSKLSEESVEALYVD